MWEVDFGQSLFTKDRKAKLQCLSNQEWDWVTTVTTMIRIDMDI
jgi:hypothetical protein